MARAFRPRIVIKYTQGFSEIEEKLGWPLGKPKVGLGGRHNWLPIGPIVNGGIPIDDKTISRCIECGCLDTNPTKVCGDPVPGHLNVYPGQEPELWVGHERYWRRAQRAKRR